MSKIFTAIVIEQNPDFDEDWCEVLDKMPDAKFVLIDQHKHAMIASNAKDAYDAIMRDCTDLNNDWNPKDWVPVAWIPRSEYEQKFHPPLPDGNELEF